MLKTIGLLRSILPLIISLIVFILVAIQPDLGTAVIILTLGLIAIFYAGINLACQFISYYTGHIKPISLDIIKALSTK